MTALPIKEAVTITVEDRDGVYRIPGTSIVDTIEIRKKYLGICEYSAGGRRRLFRTGALSGQRRRL